MLIEINKEKSISELPMEMAESVHENYKINNGILAKFPFVFEIEDWNKDQRKNRIDELNKLLLDNGVVISAKVDNLLIGIASMKSRLYSKNRLQLFSLHIDRKYRGTGIGKKLLLSVIEIAKQNGADGIYISAAPKTNTVDFYLHCGAVLTDVIENDLFNDEPDDVHLEIMWN